MNAPNKRLGQLFARILDGAAVQAGPADPDGVTPIAAAGPFGNLKFRAIWAGNGWPSDVERALAEYPRRPWPPDLVIVAHRISPGARALLEARQASWADEAGNARITSPGVLVIREGEDKPESPQAFTWSASAIATAEALLARAWPSGISTTELATLVQWSPSKVSQVLQALDDQGWTVKYGPQRGSRARRELVDPEGLLAAWTDAFTSQARDRRFAHRALRSPLDFLEGKLGDTLNDHVRWALSGWGAANSLAPFVDTVPSLQIYVHEDDFDRALDKAIDDAGLSNVAEGGRIVFFPAHPSVLALGEMSSIAPLVSSPRIYADLLEMGGRGADAAEHFKEEVVGAIHPPRGRRKAPQGMIAWERENRERLEQLTHDRPELVSLYAQGTWSASYRLTGIRKAPDLRRFMAILREVAGHETGWPPWWIPESDDIRPKPVEGMIECWHSDTAVGDAAHADYWRADPEGRLFLLRGYQEDSARERLAPSPRAGFDLTLPIWRTAECLLHAERLSRRLEATAVQFLMRWTGLRGRKLAALASRDRMMRPTRPASEDDVESFVEVSLAEISHDLGGVVRRLVDPLYASFDFFEPPEQIYEEELAEMLSRST
jgi:transcriptional regulator with XRE-family HTH domain